MGEIFPSAAAWQAGQEASGLRPGNARPGKRGRAAGARVEQQARPLNLYGDALQRCDGGAAQGCAASDVEACSVEGALDLPRNQAAPIQRLRQVSALVEIGERKTL